LFPSFATCSRVVSQSRSHGIIILQPYGTKKEVEELVNELNSLEGVTARYIDLN